MNKKQLSDHIGNIDDSLYNKQRKSLSMLWYTIRKESGSF